MIQAARMPYVRFETIAETVMDVEGMPHYKNKIMAYITSAGSKDTAVKDADEWIAQLGEKSRSRGEFDAAANEYDQWHVRFSKMLEAYKEGANMDMEGTPLRSCLAFSPAEIAQCENVKIFTVENLAVCNEEAITRMGMGGRTLKQKAEKIMETAGIAKITSAHAEKVEQENAELRKSIEELTKKFDAMIASTETKVEVGENIPKKRGPKPKPKVAE
jgi:hypothetical protein